jgi:hypothetical protein
LKTLPSSDEEGWRAERRGGAEVLAPSAKEFFRSLFVPPLVALLGGFPVFPHRGGVKPGDREPPQISPICNLAADGNFRLPMHDTHEILAVFRKKFPARRGRVREQALAWAAGPLPSRTAQCCGSRPRPRPKKRPYRNQEMKGCGVRLP